MTSIWYCSDLTGDVFTDLLNTLGMACVTGPYRVRVTYPENNEQGLHSLTKKVTLYALMKWTLRDPETLAFYNL